jgi:hypothetical protein
MNLHTYTRDLATEAFTECEHDRDEAMDYLHQSCDGLDLVIYHHKAISFCAEHDTSDGEEWLKDCGGIAQPGDTFGQIAGRITFATILVKAQAALEEIASEASSRASSDSDEAREEQAA